VPGPVITNIVDEAGDISNQVSGDTHPLDVA
jgi:hypothetical protein